MRVIISTFVLFVIWVILTQSFNPQELITGFIVASVVSMISPAIAGEKPSKWFQPKRYVYLVVYLFYFIWQMIKSNIDVAKRVINPKLPIKPGIVKLKTKLKTNAAKLALANSITLTPGTLTVDIVDDTFYIHWIDVGNCDDVGRNCKEIAEGFEKYLEVIFE